MLPKLHGFHVQQQQHGSGNGTVVRTNAMNTHRYIVETDLRGYVVLKERKKATTDEGPMNDGRRTMDVLLAILVVQEQIIIPRVLQRLVFVIHFILPTRGLTARSCVVCVPMMHKRRKQPNALSTHRTIKEAWASELLKSLFEGFGGGVLLLSALCLAFVQLIIARLRRLSLLWYSDNPWEEHVIITHGNGRRENVLQ
jgi:hypothetical protein